MNPSNNQDYNAILNGFPDPVCFIDKDETVRKANNLFCQIIGHSEEEIVGNSLKKIKHPLTQHIASIINNDQEEKITQLMNTQNQTEFWKIHNTPITHNNKNQGYLVVAKDITTIIKTREQLRAFKNKYQTLFEQTNVAVFLVNLKGEILETNQKACELLECSWENILQSSFQELISSNIQWPELVEELCAKGGTHREIKHIKKGQKMSLELSASLFKMGNEAVAVMLIHDVSDLKNMKKELRELHDPLGDYYKSLK